MLLIISFTLLQSETFEERQKTLQDIRNIVQYEESIARTYEQYILDNYKLPTISSMNTLLGGDVTSFITIDTSKVKTSTLTSGLTKLSYALGDVLKSDLGVKSLYDSNSFRKKTYVRDGAVYFILEDTFAKQLFDLIALNNNTNKEIKTCSLINSDKACIKDNHIYIKPTYTLSEITGYLMCYHIDKFKTGPIVVTSDTTKYATEDVFNSIPKGVLIYDTTGIKYIKTTSGIEVLK
jgi:hypothetical protein